MDILKIRNLNVNFGKTKILKNISLDVKKGEFIAILGPNGSGKTTLLKSISRLTTTDRNVIYINCRDIFDMSSKELAQNISVVPQNTDVIYEFTCYDVVKMGRYPYLKKFKQESLEDIRIVENSMTATSSLNLKDRLFTEISGGERQRVILAQAIAQEPDIILLDEPISNLDPQYQIEILDTIKKLSIDKELTVISILHDFNFASMYSDKIVLIENGEVYKEGNPVEVLTTENIKSVFDTDVYVSQSPITDRPHIYSKSKLAVLN